MLHKRRANFRAVIKKEREDAPRQITLRRGAHDRLPREPARAWMRRMRLRDHGIAGSKGRRRVSSSDRERERKVACSEYNRGSQRTQHRAYIRPRKRFTFRQRLVDARIHPRALFHHRCKQTQLTCRAREFTLQARSRQARFHLRALNDRCAIRRQLVGNDT